MTRTTSTILFAILIHTCLATPLWGHGEDQTLKELAGLFDSEAVAGGPDLVPCSVEWSDDDRRTREMTRLGRRA